MITRPRRAGISVPLFSLRSSRSWGIGELGDIPAAAAWLRSASQSLLQILPLNELAPGEASPYSALSAMAIDPQFISVWMLDAGPILEDVLRDELAIVRQSPGVDYQRVRSLKTRALRAAFDRFFKTDWRIDTGGAGAFRSYIRQEAWWLDEYSLYRALRAEADERPWMSWAPEFRDRDPSALSTARGRLAQEILFYQYVQWIASDQLKTARRAAEGVEILGDFPFMVTLDSADVWSRQSDFILDASVGTPPDAFSETGQEWGLPPYDWDQAQKTDFEWLRMRARRLSELYDGFRVDHLVGFYRTYVRPRDGRTPYFLPPQEDAQRALGEAVVQIMIETGSDVSVEDLGTVPDFVRQSIARLGVPGYKVLRWEPGEPSTYPKLSVAMTGTHDTETLAEWWESLPADERARFGNPAPVFDAGVRDSILGRIYESGSDVVLLPVQDVFGWRDRINQPATINEVNWTFALPWPVDRMELDAVARERAIKLGEWIHQTGRGGSHRVAPVTLPPSFDLLETMLWKPGGYFLLERHMKRLNQSAEYFGFRFDPDDARHRLERFAADLRGAQRVRMLVSRLGAISLTATPQNIDEGFPTLALAASPIDSTNPFLYHKTTNRQVYEDAVAARPGFPDVLLFNERNEVTESTLANLVVEIEGELVTPPVGCGLLPGTFRAELLEEGKVSEKVVTVERLRAARACYLMNSVRGLHLVSVVTDL